MEPTPLHDAEHQGMGRLRVLAYGGLTGVNMIYGVWTRNLTCFNFHIFNKVWGVNMIWHVVVLRVLGEIGGMTRSFIHRCPRNRCMLVSTKVPPSSKHPRQNQLWHDKKGPDFKRPLCLHLMRQRNDSKTLLSVILSETWGCLNPSVSQIVSTADSVILR